MRELRHNAIYINNSGPYYDEFYILCQTTGEKSDVIANALNELI